VYPLLTPHGPIAEEPPAPAGGSFAPEAFSWLLHHNCGTPMRFTQSGDIPDHLIASR
jgi:hypothetical protein